MRCLFTGLTAVVLTAVVTVVAPVPAQAVPDFQYDEDSSEYNTWPAKNVDVECPPDQIVYGFGGRVRGGNGDVALLAISPDEDLHSVTAVARARSDSGIPWAVIASVVCGPVGTLDLERVVGLGTPTAEVSCESPKILYSNGYVARAEVGRPYVDRVVPSADMQTVTVHAGGVVPNALHLAAVGVCGLPMEGQFNRHKYLSQNSVPVVEGSATVAVAGLPLPPVYAGVGNIWIFGAGAESTRPGMFIDGLGPVPALNAGWARMAPGSTTTATMRTVAEAEAEAEADADDGDEVTVYGEAVGHWYSPGSGPPG